MGLVCTPSGTARLSRNTLSTSSVVTSCLVAFLVRLSWSHSNANVVVSEIQINNHSTNSQVAICHYQGTVLTLFYERFQRSHTRVVPTRCIVLSCNATRPCRCFVLTETLLEPINWSTVTGIPVLSCCGAVAVALMACYVKAPRDLRHWLCQWWTNRTARSSFIQVSLKSKEGPTPPRDTGGRLDAWTFAYTTVYIVR